jgi:hypothetical protein
MELLGAIQERRAQNELELQKMQIANPARRIVQAARNPEAEWYRREAFKHEMERSGKSEDAAMKRGEEAAKAGEVDRVELDKYETKRRPLEKVLAAVNAFRQRYAGDVPGYSAIPRSEDSFTPGPLNPYMWPKDNRKAEQELEQIVQAYTHALSGAGVSEEEAKRKARAIRGSGATEEELLNGLSVLAEDARRQLEAIDRGTTKGTVDYYNSRRGDARKSQGPTKEDDFFTEQ